MSSRLTRLQVAGASFALLVCLGAVLFSVLSSEKTPFLLQDEGAAWIAFPSRPTTYVPPVEIAKPPTATFARVFALDAPPDGAELVLRALGDPAVELNGREIRFDGPCLKRACRVAVSDALRPGENELRVRVSNTAGPPLLSLRLSGEGLDVATGEGWTVSQDGSRSLAAVTADDTRPLPNATTNRTPLAALRAHGLAVATLFALSTGTFLAARGRLPAATVRRLPEIALGAVTVFWIFTFAAKVVHIPLVYGSDARDHVYYVKLILENGRLPLADEGFATYNPPAFYAVAAALMAVVAPAEGSAAEAWVLKLVPFLSGLGMVWVTWALARRLFPQDLGVQCFAVLTAGVLPLNVSIASYVSNEPFHGFLAALSLLVAVRAIRSQETSWGALVLLAAVLGLAALTRYTALMIVPIVAFFIGFGRYAAGGAPLARSVLEGFAVLAGAALLAGWVYARNWIHFGDPLIWNFDTYEGYTYWEHPGFRTADWFLRFGEVFANPYYVSFVSFWDGIYSTIWGEGLPPGGHTFRQPHSLWNYDFMSIGFLVALPAAVLFVPGLLSALRSALRGEDGARRVSLTLVLALLGAFGASLLLVNLQYAFWESTKTKYALGAVAPFALVVGLGMSSCERFLSERGGPVSAGLFYGWLGTFVGVLAWSFAG